MNLISFIRSTRYTKYPIRERTKMKAYLAVTIDSDMYRRIEQLRGREKRSTFVEHLLRLGMKEHKKAIDEENVRDVRKA